MTTTRLAYARAELDRTSLDRGDADAPLTFIASTTELNRYGFALRNDGWRLDNFNANPVLLWMHNPFQPPIGRGTALRKDGKILLDGVTFDREDELARTVESKYRRGFLSAVSCGWGYVNEDGTPISDWWRLSVEQVRDEAFYDLEEVSAVTVPGDPRALVGQSRLALARLGTELVNLLDEQEHPDGVITRDELSAAVAAELARLGIAPPTTPPAADAGVDPDAARVLLAAFPALEGHDA
jgi:hypothetical protein